jgi:phage-related tail protein
MSDELLKMIIDNQKAYKKDFVEFTKEVKINLRDTNSKIDDLSDKVNEKLDDHIKKDGEEFAEVNNKVGKLQLIMARFAGVRLALGYIVPGVLVVIWFAAQKIINSIWP